MSVLVDTAVWSLLLRRDRGSLSAGEQALVVDLRELIRDGETVLIGAVRQEVLSGVASGSHFRELRERLRAFRDEQVLTADYERAADCYNQCRARGIQGSHTDFLLCAVAIRLGVPIFTSDPDFAAYAGVLPIELYPPTDGAP